MDCTFGRIINKFEQYTIEENNRGLLLKCLKSMNIMRNGLTHQIMEMMDDDVIISVVEGYSDLAEECFYLLIEYYNCIADDIEKEITEK